MTTRQKTSSPKAVKRAQEVVEYLKSLGDAGIAEPALDITTEQQNIYIGDYSYGSSADKILHVTVSRYGGLAIGREGQTPPPSLRRVEEDGFAPARAPNVRVRFQVSDGRATTLTVHDPEPIVTAKRI